MMCTRFGCTPSSHLVLSHLTGSSFMSVMRYTGVQQHNAIRNTKGIWTTAFAIQKLATPYCPFCERKSVGGSCEARHEVLAVYPPIKTSRVAALSGAQLG